MAFSLEAALVVPLSLSIWAGFLAAGEPVYSNVRCAAALEAKATLYNLNAQHLYEERCFETRDVNTSAIQTSPQQALEICSLVIDDCRLISRIFPDEKPQGDEGREKP